MWLVWNYHKSGASVLQIKVSRFL